MKFAYELNLASGLDLDACSCVCHRWDDRWPLAEDNGDSFIVDFQAKQNRVGRQMPAHFTGLWRSATGVVFATHRYGRLFRRPAVGDAWQIDELAEFLYGIWGLADHHVYAWGMTDGSPVMLHYDGAAWAPMTAPPFLPYAVHGSAPDLLMAVGDRGAIASWNGRSWTLMHSPIRTALSSVFVVSGSEMYACGPGDFSVLEGSVYGWSPIVHGEFPLHAVAKFADKIWIAAGVNGLYTIEDSQLVRAPTDLTPLTLDARGSLVIAAINKVAHTKDGVDFPFFWSDGVIDLVDRYDPCW